MVYADFESILGPDNNGKQNPDTSKNEKHVACSCCYNLVCFEDKFRRPLTSHTYVNMLFAIL